MLSKGEINRDQTIITNTELTVSVLLSNFQRTSVNCLEENPMGNLKCCHKCRFTFIDISGLFRLDLLV